MTAETLFKRGGRRVVIGGREGIAVPSMIDDLKYKRSVAFKVYCEKRQRF